MRKRYTFSDLIAIGATKSQATHWLREGVIVPVTPQKAGTGNHKDLDLRNLLEALIALYLNAAGMTTARMKRILDLVRYIDDVSMAVATGDHERWVGLVNRASDYFEGPSAQRQLEYVATGWRAIKTPVIRENPGEYYGLSYSLHNTEVQVVRVRADETKPLGMLGPAVVLIDLGALLTALETHIGDRLEGGLTDDEIQAWVRRW